MEHEAQLELTLDHVSERAELLRERLVEWKLEIAAGRPSSGDAAPPYAEFRDVLSREAAFLLRGELASRGKTARPGTRNLLHFITESLVEATCHPARMELQQQLATLRVPFGKEQVTLPRAAARILSEQRRIERSRADLARMALLPRLDPLVHKLMERARSVAELLEFPNYPKMWEETSGTSLSEALDLCQPIIEETEDAYREMLEWFSRRVLGIPTGRVHRHDVLHLFYGGPAGEFFPVTDLIAIGAETAGEMGIPLGGLPNLSIEGETESTRPPRAHCAPLEVPARIVLLAPRAGGLRGYRQFLHEFGRALHLAHVDPEEPFETRALGDGAISESFGILFQSLLDTPIWLERHLGVERQPDLLRLLALEQSFTVRRLAAKLAYELTLHSESSLSGKAELYRELMMAYTRADFPKELYLLDAEADFRSARVLKAVLFAAQLAEHFTTLLDEDWMRNPAAGDVLRALWRTGHRHTLGELATALGPHGLSPRPFIDLVTKRFG